MRREGKVGVMMAFFAKEGRKLLQVSEGGQGLWRSRRGDLSDCRPFRKEKYRAGDALPQRPGQNGE